MLSRLIGKFDVWVQDIHADYGVHPYVFIALVVICAPFFYYSIYRLIKGLAHRDKPQVMLWSTVFLAATVVPYVYVLLFGHGMPWWIYLVLVALLLQGVISLISRLRRGHSEADSVSSGNIEADEDIPETTRAGGRILRVRRKGRKR